MRKLAKRRILPGSLANLYTLLLYPSCAFGGSMRKQWRIKDAYEKIKKAKHLTPGSLICIN